MAREFRVGLETIVSMRSDCPVLEAMGEDSGPAGSLPSWLRSPMVELKDTLPTLEEKRLEAEAEDDEDGVGPVRLTVEVEARGLEKDVSLRK